MSKYTFFTDFTTLSEDDTNNWIMNCSELAEEVFQDSSNEKRILGNLLVLEQYFYTLCQGMVKNKQKPNPIVRETIDILWDYLYGKKTPSDFENFANNMYACVLVYMVGEDLTDEQYAFYEKYFSDSEDILLQWNIISWATILLMELTAIYGGKIDFDEFQFCQHVGFTEIDEMLNCLSDACIDFTGIPRKSNMVKDVIEAFTDVYGTSLFQSIVCKVQKSLKDAINAESEDYEELKKQYQQFGILPEEYAVGFLEF